ncbi:hypothetical protein [Corynebacterium phocae]|uniref:hypothetical protein n=1 Tax=Corynebacterium phocae TaxID=161895 RepID=UPI00123A6EF1|nr:hypothetical protein [Corynebacterium phocae]KAA8721017.1 hypothetical protein F4V58_11240 [Corynebacterium phocae]
MTKQVTKHLKLFWFLCDKREMVLRALGLTFVYFAFLVSAAEAPTLPEKFIETLAIFCATVAFFTTKSKYERYARLGLPFSTWRTHVRVSNTAWQLTLAALLAFFVTPGTQWLVLIPLLGAAGIWFYSYERWGKPAGQRDAKTPDSAQLGRFPATVLGQLVWRHESPMWLIIWLYVAAGAALLRLNVFPVDALTTWTIMTVPILLNTRANIKNVLSLGETRKNWARAMATSGAVGIAGSVAIVLAIYAVGIAFTGEIRNEYPLVLLVGSLTIGVIARHGRELFLKTTFRLIAFVLAALLVLGLVLLLQATVTVYLPAGALSGQWAGTLIFLAIAGFWLAALPKVVKRVNPF